MKKTVLLAALVLGANNVQAGDLLETAEQSVEVSKFVELVHLSGMDELLKTDGPYTVFAPLNSAFASLPDEQRNTLLSDETAAKRFVASHIIVGMQTVSEIKPGERKTIAGTTLKVESDNGLVKAENASVVQSDLQADNGVVHFVDSVITTGE